MEIPDDRGGTPSGIVPPRADLVVVGAGIIGLAAARELATRRPDWTVLVLEKEAATGLHQTARNSGVVHSGVYYTPGSLKARLTLSGRERLMRFCDQHGIPYERCGKVIVATRQRELPALEELRSRGNANGVPGLRILGPAELLELEPFCSALAALHVPSVALVDFRLVANALRRELEQSGATVVLGTQVRRLVEASRGVRVETTRGELEAAFVVGCAGLHSDTLARATVAGTHDDGTRIVPFRGRYFALRPEAKRLCRSLIYPVPDQRFPFLGVHVNRRPDGEVWAGPNAVLALAREGYSRVAVDPRDAWEMLGSPAVWRLGRRYWRTGVGEVVRDLSKHALTREIQRFLPDIERGDLSPAGAGVRAQALSADGRLVDDFLFAEAARILHVKNAPSPGATSALAIAGVVAGRALHLFEGDRVAPARVASGRP
jgi:L-2-hydroxyglutarate oxidase